MIQLMIPLVASWLPIWHYYIVYIFGLALIAWIFRCIHSFFRR